MKLGVYTAILHDRSLREALETIASLGLDGAEINAGGFIGTPHLPVKELLSGEVSPQEYLKVFDETGVSIAGLNCNGNPLHADPEVGPEDAEDLRNAIRVAGLLGVDRVVAMSGLPAAHPGGQWPAWHVNTWDSGYLDSLDYQWDEVAVPFWKEIDALARENGVKVAIEMHPQNLVFNPPTLKRLVEKTGATNVGAEMDPSHLFWQGIDPVAAIEWLGDLVFHAAAKDTRINDNCSIYGVLDDRFTRIPADQNPTGLGGRHVVNKWPEDSAWDFVAVGRGHDVDFWSRFLAALRKVDPAMAVNIEHEDVELGQLEGLQVAAKTLRDAVSAVAAR
ncbi:MULTISPECIES: sugar phosphate isomerase/epimerase [unclassified Rhodococcus (in: high G+C Gram-positive bacteria)]|uniref:sugar phosphate isomerase/epimerase family protein n=1 Tax=unclassified Rhodococcus (in: high G+C Gram-positive bacteria) TaxID=192944 RepID=UPI00163B0E7C|nr:MULTISPECIES: sugar phosphate isomerase/epimerase [unclassified Rhodococcus (in: high G+C Gram-positive bacteria)]MBC2642578.1 sugar phosphate isomerase/epimerase [Rhodococcus sp. 3A]MBC2892680.1 sugar phosphate isomerase/epimerase [Rhodococcus sp. 4CII]